MISKCVITLTNNLQDPNAEEYAVLGSCSVLASQTVLKHLTTVIVMDDVLKICLCGWSVLSCLLHALFDSRIQSHSLHLSWPFFRGISIFIVSHFR